MEHLFEVVIAAALDLFAGDHDDRRGRLAQALLGARHRGDLGGGLLAPHLRDERGEARRRAGLEGGVDAQQGGDLLARLAEVVGGEEGACEERVDREGGGAGDPGAEAGRELPGDVFEEAEIVALLRLDQGVVARGLRGRGARPGKSEQEHENDSEKAHRSVSS